MSASSWWVTCGIITQLRARSGPDILLIRESSTRSIGPNFANSSCRPRRQIQTQTGPTGRSGSRCARGSGRTAIHKCLDVLLGDPALAAAAGHAMRGLTPSSATPCERPGSHRRDHRRCPLDDGRSRRCSGAGRNPEPPAPQLPPALLDPRRTDFVSLPALPPSPSLDGDNVRSLVPWRNPIPNIH